MNWKICAERLRKVLMCSFVVMYEMFKGTDWYVPFRWMILICVIAYAADYFVNRR